MIWGTTKSYILNGVDTITLNKSTTSFGLFENQDKRYRSILTGVKKHTRLSDYSNFSVLIWLWQETDPKAKLQTLLALVGNQATFYFQGATVLANCYIETVRPFYFRNLRDYDACVVSLFPVSYSEISQGLLNEDGTPLLNEDGSPLLSEGFTLV